MKINLPVTGREVTYDDDTVIISTTDLKGVITYTNNDFIRISGFSQDELEGKSHNIVRHPDMPPEAFEDLWRTVKSGRSWRGIVKNRCKNGDHYWVDAFVTPIYEGDVLVGYQSVRTRPTREAVKAAETIYAKLRDKKLTRLPKQRSIYNVSLKLRLGGAMSVIAVLFLALGIFSLFGDGGQKGILLLSLLGLGLTGASWILLLRTVVQPLGTIKGLLLGMAGGKLRQHIDAPHNDDIGQLLQAVKLLQARLGTVLGHFSEAAQSLAQSAEQLHLQGSDSLQSMERQQDETTQVATAMTEMSASVHEVAKNTGEAASAAQVSDDEAQGGKELVLRTRGVIHDLAREVEHTTEVVTQLKNNSDQISTIVTVISGIAEQTNLLALNAAIEAARAGEQGRGFAVVADEVRTLAQRTQTSTIEIRDMIEQLQTGIHDAVEVMALGQEQATSAVSHIDETEHSLDSISAAVATIRNMNIQIAAAAEEQTAVAEEMNRNVVSISDLSESSTENARQVATAGSELADMARELQRLLSQFNR